MCNICGNKGYTEIIYYEVCKNCSYTPEQIKNRAWNNCRECQGRGSITRVIKNRCPYCHFHNINTKRF